jgi:hypothetical protein
VAVGVALIVAVFVNEAFRGRAEDA